MEKGADKKNLQFDLEGQNNNINNNIVSSESHKGTWPELRLESPGADDSGHFTASPETENSGSSRGHSPLTLTFQECQPPSSASLVQQACREKNHSMKEGRTGTSVSSESQGSHPNLNSCQPSVSEVRQPARLSPNNIRSPVGIKSSLNSQMPTSGEGDDGSHSSEYLRTVLDNFNALYREKLKMIEDAGAQGDVYTKQIVMEKKASVLECWAKDVCVQNIVLIHTVEELEKQADEKLTLLQKKIHESTNLAKQHISVIQKYESQAKSLMKDKETSKEAQRELKRELEKLKSEYKRIRERIKDLEKDNDSLVTLITRIRDMGVWDTAGLELHKRTYEHVFGLYPDLPGSEVQTVFTRDKARRILETEERVVHLEREVFELTGLKNESDLTLSTKESKLVELEKEFKIVSNKLQHCQNECEHYKKSLIDTQEKLLEATKELQVQSIKTSRVTTPNPADTARHAEIQELLQELRIVKTQLSSSVNESQSAKLETNLIRKEFNERLQSMQESHQCMTTELTHSFGTHCQFQEKEAQLSKVNEQVRNYQSKCEAAEQLLSKKDNIIEDLQKQVEQLNKKEVFRPPDTVANLSSETTKPAHSTSQSALTCGRDHLHKEQTQLQTSVVKISSKNLKPRWNEHFVKGSSLNDPVSNLTLISSKKVLHSKDKKRYQGNSSNSLMSSDQTNEKYAKLHQATDKSHGSFSFCSCGSQDARMESSNKSSEIKETSFQHNSGFSLPKLEEDFDLKTELLKLKEMKSQIGVGNNKFPQLPKINTKKSRGSKEPEQVFPSVENPFARYSTYDLMMDIAVKASKKMMASDNTESNNQVSSIRVLAGHSKRNQSKSKFDATKSNKQKLDPSFSQKQNQENPKSNSKHGYAIFPKKYFCNDLNNFNSTKKLKEVCLASARLKFDNVPDMKTKCSPSLEDLLSELPEQLSMHVVQEWMNKTSTSQLNSVGCPRVPRKKRQLLRKPKCSVTKQLSARRTPRIMSARSNSSVFTAKKKLAKDISDIKNEWSRVFENLDKNMSINTTGEIEESTPESMVDNRSGTYGSMKDVKEEFSLSLTPLTPVTAHTLEATTAHTHTLADTSTMEKLAFEKLKKEFEAEKAKLEEDFKKELKDKDIEITMQKVTIQHLQGALVALKRGQPIPVPQSSVGKQNGSGTVSNCGKDLNGNVSAFGPLRENGVLVPDGSSVAGYENACLWEMMNSFEELKLTALQQLEDLKNGNNMLTSKSVCMEKKISLFRHLMFIRDIRQNITSAKVKQLVSTATEDEISTGLGNELQEMKQNCRSMIYQCAMEAENVKLLTKVDDSLKNEIAEVQWQLERYKALAIELESELVGTKAEITQLKDENQNLRKEKTMVEEDLWTVKIEMLDLKNDNALENNGYFAPLKRLEAMKTAFNKNEEIIQKQKQELENRNILIGKYAKYCSIIQTLTRRKTNEMKLDMEKEYDNNDFQEMGRSLDSFPDIQRKGQSLKEQDDVFIDTVKSLTGHIEELLEHNENFIKHIPNGIQKKAFSNPLASMDLRQGCGDFINEVSTLHFQAELNPQNQSSTKHLPINVCQSSALLFEDLTRMAKSAERIGLSSQDIISASVSLLDMKTSTTPNLQLSPFPFRAD